MAKSALSGMRLYVGEEHSMSIFDAINMKLLFKILVVFLALGIGISSYFIFKLPRDTTKSSEQVKETELDFSPVG